MKESALLWSLFKQGNWDAYAELYDTHYKLLNNYGYKFTKDVELIQDAVHDLFVKLWTNKGTLSDPPSVKNYLYKSLRNILFRKMESQARFTNLGNDDDYNFTFEVSFDHHLIADETKREMQSKIKAAIQTLPARQQEIIYLRFYEGLNYDEVADIMAININSAYKLLYKAFNNLQLALKTSKFAIAISLYSCLGTHIHNN